MTGVPAKAEGLTDHSAMDKIGSVYEGMRPDRKNDHGAGRESDRVPGEEYYMAYAGRK